MPNIIYFKCKKSKSKYNRKKTKKRGGNIKHTFESDPSFFSENMNNIKYRKHESINDHI
jgi:hypothetical protein